MATERDYFHDLAEDLVHGAEESYVADLSEEMLDLLEQGMASEDRWAVMAMRCREAAMGVWARHTGAVTSQCERAFTRALSREDEAIVSSLASEFSAPTGLTNRAANEVMEASRGLAEIISRQNVALADNLADTWWRVTADAVTRTQLGDDPRDVMEDAVSFLSKAGLETIDYRSGQRTSIDAAVRRHTVTQANQCRNDMLVRQCEAYEVDLVFTSAHWGCRPTHAEWQGKPFSLHGTVEVDGVTYRDLSEATGYGTVQGLCGANCRHRLTPYVPGLSQLPDTDFRAFEEKYHMTSEEYYRATQRQRALERQVRATKREIALGQERGLDMTEARYRLGAQQRRLREHCAMTGLPRDGERERAYGVKAQPRALSAKHVPSPSEDRSILRVDNVSEHKFVKGSGSYATEIVTDAQRITLKSGQTLYVAKGTPVDYRNDLVRQFRKLPKSLKGTVRTIDILNVENPDDEYWRKRVKDYTRSAGTGGDKTITVYLPGLDYRGGELLGLIAHEAGHCFDDAWKAAHGEDFSWSHAWLGAMKEDEERTGSTFITDYARRMHGSSQMREDLADSVRWLVRARNGFSIDVDVKEGKMPIEEAYASRMSLLREVLSYGNKD